MNAALEMPDAGGAVHVRTYVSTPVSHSHAFHQIVIPLAGRLEIEVGGRGGRVADLWSVYVPAGERHAFFGSRENRVVVLDVAQDLVDELDGGSWLARRSRDNFFLAPHPAMRLATTLADGWASAEPLAGVQRAWATLTLSALVQAERRRTPAAVVRALGCIETRALGPLRISDVASAAGVSPSHLHALFRANVGRTPRAVLIGRRLEAARQLLLETDDPIADVALRCGFADQPSLTHAMRRVLGTTPGELRQGQRARGRAAS